jgi:signal transduction histidine kinase
MSMTRSLVGDLLLAGALAVLSVSFAAAGFVSGNPDRPVDPLGLALIAMAGSALAVRRRWPLPTLAVVTVLTSGYLVVGYPYGLIMVSFLVAVYTAARYLPMDRSGTAAAAALVVLLTHLLTNSAALPGLLGVVPGSAWVVVPYAIGVTVRLRRQSLDLARAEAVRQRVDEERLRVAQEVHDVVGHGLAAIKMQADVALHVLPRRPDQAEAALTTISRTSTEALGELRATLALVRRTGADPARSPAPGLGQVEDLRRRMGEAGMRVDLDVSGAPRALPPAVDLAGYRVVQESLTNVLRHSRAKIATVRVGYRTDTVVVTISNPAASAPGRHDGLGIPGMRERVEALGGQFSAGPADGRFEVRAVLPAGGSS